jgi:4a-hydroxytetrahydrobiopterin dehydratase
MEELTHKNIIPARKGEPPATQKETEAYLKILPDWEIVEREGIPRLERSFEFPNFQEALDFTNLVGELAEEVDHHPAVLLTWGRAAVSWWTHVIRDLHENDFILAARTEAIYQDKFKE